MMGQPDQSSYFLGLLRISPYTPLATGSVDPQGIQLKPNIGQILRSKRVRIVSAAALVVCVVAFFFYGPRRNLNFEYLRYPSYSESPSLPESPSLSESPSSSEGPSSGNVDWSRYAYTQYVTNIEYLCNSVMLFEILHRLGSRADRLMMYPTSMRPDPASSSVESHLLLKAQNEYGVKLMPIEVQYRPGKDPANSATWADSYTKLLAFNQTQYERVLSLDSDSTVLQSMDELFLLPPSPVAMPRAYWLDKPYLSSQLLLIEPSVEEFARVKEAIDTAKDGNFDMEIVNDLYAKDCMVLPHRRYDLLTGEFRSQGLHTTYLGNNYEHWDPERILKEAKFLHFSDWPMQKPWISANESIKNEAQPKCERDHNGQEDCRARDLWLQFYSDFKERRKNVCGMELKEELKPRSIEMSEKSSYEFVPAKV